MGTRISKEQLASVLDQKFGDLQPIEYLGERFLYGAKRHFYKCLCVCGNIVELNYNKLQTGNNTSCGCMKDIKTSVRMKTHGMRKTPEYEIWAGMKARCCNVNHEAYKTYGGAGIEVDVSWLNNFSQFYTDMGPRPSKNHSIERKDPNGNYCKENCVWTDDPSLQAFNKKLKSTNTSGRTGISQLKSGRFTASICHKYEVHYLGSFDTYEEACEVRSAAELKYFGFIKEE